MENLAAQVNNVFDVEFDDTLVKEYFERNERKKADEKWLDKHKPVFKRFMQEQGKDKADVGDYRVVIVNPDTSHFDQEKLLAYVKEICLVEALKEVIDEEGLTKAIEDGLVALEDLQAVAWIESTGTPRLTIKKLKKDED